MGFSRLLKWEWCMVGVKFPGIDGLQGDVGNQTNLGF